MKDRDATRIPAAQDTGFDAVFIEESFAGAKRQIADRTHHPIVVNIIDAQAALARAAVGVFGQTGVAKRAETTRSQN